MLTSSFVDGVELLKIIEKSGHQAFFVGGSVRDLLLEREIGDIDITTSASPEQIQALFPKVIPVGIEHGTVIVRHNHMSYEVTTFRLDGKYSDQRHPDHVEFISDIKEDLRRRDFTINAMAMDKQGTIIDLFSGKNDLEHRVIRTVGNGFDRFSEDPLRIIRALRFVSQIGFTVEQKTLEDMIKVKAQIESLAIERIKNEMTKFFAGNYIDTGISSLKKTGIYLHLPLLKDYPDLVDNLPSKLFPLGSFGEIVALFHYIKKEVSVINWIKDWKCSNNEKREAIELSNALEHYKKNGLDQWLLYQLPVSYYPGFMRLVQNLFKESELTLDNIFRLESQLVIRSKQDLCINGNDLTALFPHHKKGPWLTNYLNKIEKEVVFERLTNTKKNLKEWITCNPPEIN